MREGSLENNKLPQWLNWSTNSIALATTTQNIHWDNFFPYIRIPIIMACDLKDIIPHFPSDRAQAKPSCTRTELVVALGKFSSSVLSYSLPGPAGQ